MTLNTEAFAKALAAGIAAYEAASREVDGWIMWSGGECPVNGVVPVDVRYRDGDWDSNTHASDFGWKHVHGGLDIIAYRLAQ